MLYSSKGKITLSTNNGSSLIDALVIDSSQNADISGNLSVSGDLTIMGTTTTVNSIVVTVDDPILTLGGDTDATTDDNMDRGILFKWNKLGALLD